MAVRMELAGMNFYDEALLELHSDIGRGVNAAENPGGDLVSFRLALFGPRAQLLRCNEQVYAISLQPAWEIFAFNVRCSESKNA